MTPRAPLRATSAGAVTARPPARATERHGARRTSWSWSQSRQQCRWGLSPLSRCLPGPATEASGAIARPLPAAARARAARRPRRERRRGSGPPARTSGVRTPPARPRRPATPRPAVRRRCSRPQPDHRQHGCDERRLTGTPDPSVLLAARVVHARPPRNCLRGTMRRWSHRPRTAQPRLKDDELGAGGERSQEGANRAGSSGLNSPLRASAGLNPPDFSGNERKWTWPMSPLFMRISSAFLAHRAQCGIASHARTRWFETTRADSGKPW